jgi:hypothetical protein
VEIKKKSKKKKKKKNKENNTEGQQPKEKRKEVTFQLLDTLFAFIGVSQQNDALKTTQSSKLNMF